ncbi:hypothetical protein GOODEAATRI_000719 [Goodea atripinnis]|uniref:Uncharacterized protein n=1 Tax=Goodea atripinnis TaxID=208336 RepID=A0ABV0MEA6_9TELE
MPCACHEAGAETDTCELFGGQCKCRPSVIGRDCSMCATGYWGFPHCRREFVFSGPCRGRTQCRNNVVGRQCDRCAPGFYGYPNCRPCDCNEAGTQEEVCDSFTGLCLCKENVQGSRCDQCRIGTFHLDPTNPKGCTSCFCFGATDRCQSSDKRRVEVMDMDGWVLLGADRQEVPVAVYPDQDLVEADLSDVPDVYQDLHWHAPKTYLGDKVSSYGGSLRYRLHTQTMRGDALPLPAEASRPDIILKGNQMTLVFMEREYSAPEDPHLGIVHIVEGSFRHAQTGNSVSREELMMVLVNLESLQIRALHSQSAHSVSLRGAVLEGAADLPSGRHANNVEICMCPANYLGDSCQVTTGTLSDYSLENVFPVTVTDTRTNVWMDLESVWCAPGFYGNPMVLGSRCQPCHCNGNTDPNMLFTDCHPLTGQCLSCMHNSAGPHCDVCAPGYYGDAIHAKNCTKCQCSPCGTESCDRHTGQCRCKPGVTGLFCDHCQGSFGFNSCSGCRHCECEASAALVQPCDPQSVCDSCVIVLLDDLDRLNDTFSSIAWQLRNLNASSMAWTQLDSLNKSIEDVALVIENYNTMLDESRNRANMLDLDIVANNADIDDLLRKEENLNLTQAIRDRLLRFRSEMIDLRDALNEAVNNTARAAELNSVNEKSLEKHNRKIEDLLMTLKEVNDTMDMAVADITQVNTVEINEAKTVAEKANSTATKVNNMLRPIKEQLDQWQQAYGDTNSTSNDINKALINASETVQKLEEHIPTLMKKLDDLQNYSVQMPNISENINRIRQLIQEARNTASKVRTPSNLADLAAYSSLKFYITLSETKQRKRSSDDTKPQLVFFLGNKNVCLTTASQMDILWTRGTNAYYFYNHYHVCCICRPKGSFWA